MRKNPYRGVFIVFEGIDGSGKTTQAAMLSRRMEEVELSIFATREPTKESAWGQLVRFIYTCQEIDRDVPRELTRFLSLPEHQEARTVMSTTHAQRADQFVGLAKEMTLGKMSELPLLLQLGMIFDRREHRIQAEIPEFKRGVHVVSDRDFLSTLAYGAADDLSWPDLLTAHEDILGKFFIVPDLVFLVDIPVATGMKRTLTKQNGAREYFDTEERLTKISAAYEEITENPAIRACVTIVHIDGARSPETIHQEIWTRTRTFLRKRN